jgi:uncharacterized membrane protein YGL010W
MKDYIICFAIYFSVTIIIGVFVQIFYIPIGLDFILGLAFGVAVGNTLIEYIKNKSKK